MYGHILSVGNHQMKHFIASVYIAATTLLNTWRQILLAQKVQPSSESNTTISVKQCCCKHTLEQGILTCGPWIPCGDKNWGGEKEKKVCFPYCYSQNCPLKRIFFRSNNVIKIVLLPNKYGMAQDATVKSVTYSYALYIQLA